MYWLEMTVRGYIIIIVTFMIVVFPLEESYALSPSYHFRHLYQQQQTNLSPSPSPSHGGLYFHCNTASRSCQLKNLTACLSTYYSQSGPHEEIGLFVHNNGENPLHVKITILPANNTIEELDLPSHQIQKINISSDIDLSSAIGLSSSHGDCIIHAAAAAAAPAPQNYSQKYSSFGTYITPINGACLVILLFLIGGIFTFFRKRIRGRHLDGVPYQELEMGDSTALSSLNVEENEKETWNQDWDDEWGDEKPIKSDGDDNIVIVEQANGLTTKLPSSNGMIKEWND